MCIHPEPSTMLGTEAVLGNLLSFPQSGMILTLPFAPQKPSLALLTCDLAVTVHVTLPPLECVTLEGRDLA